MKERESLPWGLGQYAAPQTVEYLLHNVLSRRILFLLCWKSCADSVCSAAEDKFTLLETIV